MKKQTTLPTVDNSKDKSLIEAYTDKFGNKMFTFIDIEVMPKCRILACERAARYCEMYVSETRFKKALAQIIDAGGKGDWATAISILKELEYHTHYIGETESLMEIAAAFYMFQDEDPWEFHTSDIISKTELWNKDSKAKDFFLCEGMRLSSVYSGKLPDATLTYLKSQAHQEREARLVRLTS